MNMISQAMNCDIYSHLHPASAVYLRGYSGGMVGVRLGRKKMRVCEGKKAAKMEGGRKRH